MTKHIIKIRPYRVFKKDGFYYIKINNKKVYIRHGDKSKISRYADKQIIRVVVNNLQAQRRSRRRTVKPKPVLGITSTAKPVAGTTAPSGASSGSSTKIDITKITSAKDTNDPLYANANKAPGQVEDAQAQPKGTSNQLTIKHDFSGLSSSMYAAYKYGLSEKALGDKIWGIPGAVEDMSNPDDPLQASAQPGVEQNDRGQLLLHDGFLDPNVKVAIEPQIDRQPEITEEERYQNELARYDEEEARVIANERAGARAVNPHNEDEEAPLGTELTAENLKERILQENINSHGRLYSIPDLIDKIREFYPNFRDNSIKPTIINGEENLLDGFMNKYVSILMEQPTYISPDIEPRPDIKELKTNFLKMSGVHLRDNVLPLFVIRSTSLRDNPYDLDQSYVDAKLFDKMKGYNLTNLRVKLWDLIMEDPDRRQKKV